ncbi:NAD(P)/FAD-dependent oxidoreductase [Streptomyces sp. I6]|uniref:flavin-containing monooxygenase n=1 Tax=Streptomyces sp. I6 TaxID=2483113 RepID=UPI000F44D3B0|nr:NAD(P)/FAD-dependent oxidoreductase [Streptomyces sp. I6]RNL72402.1 NAD(P)/FAD-dependent oxidoreductase [Streptomyces sp. I6]
MPTPPAATEELDILVIGAGISGIGVGCYLVTEQPAKSFAMMEARGAPGGTWDLFRYPGIRSDSDLYTFGYEFKPWPNQESIASAPRILDYLKETLKEYGLGDHIRYHHRVVSADWSDAKARWLVHVERTDTGERLDFSARWIFTAGGYYRYDKGFVPHFKGREKFRGRIVHPQNWPDDIDFTGERVVVIGSGATAVTLVPAMARTAAHVTMLQRTPTYVLPLPERDRFAQLLMRVFGRERGYALTRSKNIIIQRELYRYCQRFPKSARRLIRKINVKCLPPGFPVDTHFNPPYDPWQQRLCIVPNGDLFHAIRDGSASIVTGHIAEFTEHGILLESGRELKADFIVTATGFNLQPLGGIQLSVNGRPVRLPETFVYRGMMLSGVPNFAFAVGYQSNSWTLKVGLVCEYFCKLLSYMDANGHDTAWPVADPDMPSRPMMRLTSGYVQRSVDRMPRQGTAAPWLMSTDFRTDRKLLLESPVTDSALHFSSPAVRAHAPETGHSKETAP